MKEIWLDKKTRVNACSGSLELFTEIEVDIPTYDKKYRTKYITVRVNNHDARVEPKALLKALHNVIGYLNRLEEGDNK